MTQHAATDQSTNPIIREVVDALRILSDGGELYAATEILQLATRRTDRPLNLTNREYAEILGWLGHGRRRCKNCGELVLFVADGPQPGWWEHDLIPAEFAHPANPVVVR